MDSWERLGLENPAHRKEQHSPKVNTAAAAAVAAAVAGGAWAGGEVLPAGAGRAALHAPTLLAGEVARGRHARQQARQFGALAKGLGAAAEAERAAGLALEAAPGAPEAVAEAAWAATGAGAPGAGDALLGLEERALLKKLKVQLPKIYKVDEVNFHKEYQMGARCEACVPLAGKKVFKDYPRLVNLKCYPPNVRSRFALDVPVDVPIGALNFSFTLPVPIPNNEQLNAALRVLDGDFGALLQLIFGGLFGDD